MAWKMELLDRICQEDGSLDPDCFQPAQDFVFHIIENRYFVGFLTSVYYCKHQVDVLTSGNVGLADILHNQTALSYFMELLDRDGQRRYVEFWLAADSFAQDLTRRKDYSVVEAQNDAMVLYDKYFSMQASHPLEFGDDIRVELELNICRPEGGPLPDCFDRAQRYAFAIINQNYLQRFLRSSLFKSYLSELIHTIETTLELPNMNRPRRIGSTTGSDRSSNQSFASSSSFNGSTSAMKRASLNTLLATDETTIGRRSHNATAATSSNETLNSIEEKRAEPDTLWRRRQQKGIPMAQVDQFGRYHRAFDDKFIPSEMPMTKGQKLRNNIDKMIHRTDREALVADEMAQLIIADIQNMVSSAAHSGGSELPNG